MIQKLRSKMYLKQKGFTLIELMIVIAIIGILAAIAVPQFLSYRMRSYNTAAKAVINNMKADNANLNAELGVFGHTTSVCNTLAAPYQAFSIVNSNTPAPTFENRLAASPGASGARLIGSRSSDNRVFAVGVALGPEMWADVRDVNDNNDNSTYVGIARHHRGDTAYGIDSDIENQLYSVSNSDGFPNSTSIAAINTGCASTTPPLNNLAGQPGNGGPTANWSVVR